MSPTEPPISIYGTLPRSNFRRLSAAAPLPDSGEYTHYATLRRDQLTSSRISLRQLGVMVEAEERRRMEEGEGSDGSIASNSPDLDGKDDRKKKKGREGRIALGRLLPGAMVYSHLTIAPLIIQTLIVNKN
jgi:hypothetical protein